MSALAKQRHRAKRIAATLALISACAAPTQANAWTLIPGLPNPVTWVLHFIGGVFIEHYAQKEAQGENAGVAVSGPLGVAKEFTDLHFDPIDAIMWPLGAFAYRLANQAADPHILQLHHNSALRDGEIPWYMQPHFPHTSPEAADEMKMASLSIQELDLYAGIYLGEENTPWYMRSKFPYLYIDDQATK